MICWHSAFSRCSRTPLCHSAGGKLVSMILADWLLPLVHNIGLPGFRISALAWMFLACLVAWDAASRQDES